MKMTVSEAIKRHEEFWKEYKRLMSVDALTISAKEFQQLYPTQTTKEQEPK